jgi:holliday junction DNA helicase RuvB
VRLGMLARTPRGRVATSSAWIHLGLTPPDRVAGSVVMDDGAVTLFDGG